MDDSTVALLVMLNNLLHDFAVALLFASLLVQLHLLREARSGDASRYAFVRKLARHFNAVTIVCWVVIIVGGVVRTLAYQRFEWNEAAGRGQVVALGVKHLLLGSLVVCGTVIQVRLRKLLKERNPT